MGGCTPAARTRPLVSGARTSGQRWGGAEAGRCPDPSLPAAAQGPRTWTQHAPLCASLSILRGPGLSHMRDGRGVSSRWPRWPGDEPGAPLPPRKRRGPPRVAAQPLPRRRPWPSCLPPPSGRATISGAEARSRHGCAFRGRRGEVTPSPNLLLRRESRSRGLRPEGGRGRLEPFRVPRPLAPPHSCLVGNKSPRPGRVIGHPDGGICLLNLDVSCAPHLAVLQGLRACFCIPPLTSAPFRGSPPSISSLPHHRVTSNLPAFYLWHPDPRPAPAPRPQARALPVTPGTHTLVARSPGRACDPPPGSGRSDGPCPRSFSADAGTCLSPV